MSREGVLSALCQFDEFIQNIKLQLSHQIEVNLNEFDGQLVGLLRDFFWLKVLLLELLKCEDKGSFGGLQPYRPEADSYEKNYGLTKYDGLYTLLNLTTEKSDMN